MHISAFEEINRDLYNGETIIYGCAKCATDIYKRLAKYHIDVAAFTATDTMDMKEFCGKPVWNLNEVERRYHEKTYNIVIGTINRKFIDQMISNLSAHGITEKIFSILPNYEEDIFDTSQMKLVIQENKSKIDWVKQHLFDDRSREILDNMLNLRMTNDMDWAKMSQSHDHMCYFPPEISASEDEVFVDGGGYDGDTIEEFIKFCGSKYKHIYSFEPDDLLFPILKDTVNRNHYSNVSLCQKGLYQEETTLSFENRHTMGAKISDKGELQISVIDLDTFFEKESNVPTFIKMDIEGAEKEALIGCKRIIRNYAPKLAICIYHLPDDLWEIPYWLMTNFPNYNYYIRHYGDHKAETLLYAIPQKAK